MGGGGDGGYGAQQQAQDAAKARARAAVNLQFGIAPAPGSATVDRSAFERPGSIVGSGGGSSDNDMGGGNVGAPGYFDEAGYQAALAGQGQQDSTAATNKTALDALYSGVRKNAFDAGNRQIQEQAGTAGRNLKFELFARGLNGGSVDVDQNALLGRKTTDAVTKLGAAADGTATNLRSSDEATRLGLLQSIDSGMDQTSALSSALTQMKNNADSAGAAATGTSIGDLFSNVGLLYDQGRRAQGQQQVSSQGMPPWLYGGQQIYGSQLGRNPGGIISKG